MSNQSCDLKFLSLIVYFTFYSRRKSCPRKCNPCKIFCLSFEYVVRVVYYLKVSPVQETISTIKYSARCVRPCLIHTIMISLRQFNCNNVWTSLMSLWLKSLGSCMRYKCCTDQSKRYSMSDSIVVCYLHTLLKCRVWRKLQIIHSVESIPSSQCGAESCCYR